MASGKPSQAPAAVATVAPPKPSGSMFAWVDDWTPEASGIFRIFRREPPKPEADSSTTALNLPRTDHVPLPAGRPAPSDTDSESTLAFAASEQ
jgi:hypothetical protein